MRWLLLEAIGDVQGTLPNVVLCIVANRIGAQHHGKEGIRQLWILAGPQGHHPFVLQLLCRCHGCKTTYHHSVADVHMATLNTLREQ